jgi:TolB-like protein/DNA-binding SARP family transcriptional activator/rhodanese-related sulfurtransferase
VQLIDATTGHHLWAERYDRDASDFFAIQEDILRTIVASLASQVTEAEIGRALTKETGNLSAYDYYQRAWKLFFTFTKDGNNDALELLEKAIKLDPGYARAYGLLAWVHAHNSSKRYSWGQNPELSLDLALEAAQEAVTLATDDYFSHWALGFVHSVHGDFDRASAGYERALALNPSDATLLVNMTEVLYKTGRAEQAIAQIKLAMRINPRHPDWYFWDLGIAQYLAEQYPEALETLNRMSNPSNGVRRIRAAVLVRLGRVEDARRVISRFIETDVDITLEEMEAFDWTDREGLGRWISDLRTAGLPEKRPLPLPDKPSIAVLPFTNMSDDPKQEYFVDGITEDLITDLSKLSGLFVIARNSSFVYKGKPVNVRQVAEELGVRYVLEGSVRRAGDEIRVNAQLIDALSGGHIWAERYDSSMNDVFDVQDKVTRNVVAALEVHLTDKEQAARARQETDSSEAYDAFLRGRAHYDLYSKDDFAKAISYLEKALQLDPNYARAHAVLAAVYRTVGDDEWAPALGMSYDESQEKMEHHLKEALKDPAPLAHHIASRLLTRQGRTDEALAEAKRAVELDPNDVDGYTALARIYIKTGKPAEALEVSKKGQRLDPQGDVRGKFSYRLGESYFHLDRFEESAAEFEKYTRLLPSGEWGFLYLAAAYGYLDRKQEAESALENFNQLRATRGRPSYTLADMDAWIFPDESVRERYREGLRKAGMPQGSQRTPLAFRGIDKAPLEIEGATTIDATEAKPLFDRGVPFIDLRGAPNWPRGHIPGAVLLHRNHDFTEAKLSEIAAKDQEVVLYACGASCGVTARMVATAVSMGFKRIYFFRDGFPGWKAAGHPVEVPSE